ncbi:VOC family protein [Devosia sp.]|uniref:VOC family protein n=1 Tax=Devosia sp. TaxID=1871048 RepID=UPI0019F184D7|nr:VOC family protein [Devosia sp.]MBE0581924.1 VOC family protein [Devosia sp.]
MPNMTLDHVSLMVRSLEPSSKFYTEVLGLVPIHNGTEKRNIRWFGIADITSLHITEGDFGDTRLKKQTHFALCVDDFDGFVAELKAKGRSHWSTRRIPPDLPCRS